MRESSGQGDIIKRLALIDEAQKRITELSSNVVSLKDLLADKRARGAFGEVQLATLLRNVLPEAHFSLQHTLSNEKRADCLLILPRHSGPCSLLDCSFRQPWKKCLAKDVLLSLNNN